MEIIDLSLPRRSVSLAFRCSILVELFPRLASKKAYRKLPRIEEKRQDDHRPFAFGCNAPQDCRRSLQMIRPSSTEDPLVDS